MTRTVTSPPRESRSSLTRLTVALRRSFFLSLAAFGILLVLLGYAFDAVLPLVGYHTFEGVVAGMFGIWGATAIAVGGGAFGVLRYFREY